VLIGVRDGHQRNSLTPARSNTVNSAESSAAQTRLGIRYSDRAILLRPKRFRAAAYPLNVEPGSSVLQEPYVAETIESDMVVDADCHRRLALHADKSAT
jgi:hypothetical protein